MRTDGIRSGYPAGAGRTRSGKSGRRSGALRQDAAAYGLDGFSHADEQLSLYTDYDAHGRYKTEGARVLPNRYYTGEVGGSVCYKGGTVSYLALLEEAVFTGAVTLDETLDVWANVRRAEKELIESRAKPLYAWSSTLYSEDGQYRYRVEDGEITGTTRAFYVDGEGRRITVQYLAEQLASGVLPSDLDGELSFLAKVDGELYDKARMLGTAARKFREADALYRDGKLEHAQYRDDIHIFLLYFLGRDEGIRSATQLRVMLTDPEFGKKALEGKLRQSAPSAVHRRPITAVTDSDPAWLKPRTRRRVGVDPS